MLHIAGLLLPFAITRHPRNCPLLAKNVRIHDDSKLALEANLNWRNFTSPFGLPTAVPAGNSRVNLRNVPRFALHGERKWIEFMGVKRDVFAASK